MTNKERHIMIDLNSVGDVDFQRSDKQTLQMLEVINKRVVYLYGDLEEKD